MMDALIILQDPLHGRHFVDACPAADGHGIDPLIRQVSQVVKDQVRIPSRGQGLRGILMSQLRK